MRSARIAGRRHVDALTQVKYRPEHATDRLSETVGGILRGRTWVRVSAVPGWTATHRARGEAMDDLNCRQARQRNECENQEAVIGAAAFRHRHDREPRIG